MRAHGESMVDRHANMMICVCRQVGANAVCQVCNDGGGDEHMVLCDACDMGYHYDCLTPPLKGGRAFINHIYMNVTSVDTHVHTLRTHTSMLSLCKNHRLNNTHTQMCIQKCVHTATHTRCFDPSMARIHTCRHPRRPVVLHQLPRNVRQRRAARMDRLRNRRHGCRRFR